MQSFLPLIVLSCVACVMGYRHIARNAPGLHTQANHSNGLKKAALLVIDVQDSFITGGLAVPGAAGPKKDQPSRMIANIISLLDLNWGAVVVTEDKHPAKHISFITSHEHNKKPVLPMKWNNVSGNAILCQVGDAKYWAKHKAEYKKVYNEKMYLECAQDKPIVEHNQILWPEHCIVGSKDAKTRDDTYPGIIKHDARRATSVVHKGMNDVVDSYSAIANNIGIPEFEGLVFDVGEGNKLFAQPKKTWKDILRLVSEVYVVGLATEFCVASTALHALTLLKKETYIIKDATLGVWLAEDQIKHPGPEKNVNKRKQMKTAFEARLVKDNITLVDMKEVVQKATIDSGNMLEIGARADFS